MPTRTFALRLVTAAALLAAFGAALWCLDRRGFSLVAALVVFGGGMEWAALQKLAPPRAAAYGIFCALLMLSLLAVPGAALLCCALASVLWLAVVPWWLARGGMPAGGAALLGVLVLVPAGLALSSLERGQVLMVLGLVWVADTAAYLAGRAFGRRKLAPSISPGKTWEGVAGAVFGVAAYAIIWGVFDGGLATRVQGATWLVFLAAAAIVCAVSIVGDLYESALKRRAGVKDSGRLLPGHGGVLDRIDSATAALPVSYVLLRAGGLA